MEVWELVVAGIVGIGTIFGNTLILKWIKQGVDDVKKKQIETELNLAKNYSTSDNMIQTIALINAPVQQSIDSLKTDMTDMSKKLDMVLDNQMKKVGGRA